MDAKTFGPETTIRCNRCNTKSVAGRQVEAERENGKAWRIERMMTVEPCGHMDSHWVYEQDNAKETPAAPDNERREPTISEVADEYERI